MWKRASTRRNNDDDYVGDDDDDVDGVGKLCPVRPCAISIYYLPPSPLPLALSRSAKPVKWRRRHTQIMLDTHTLASNQRLTPKRKRIQHIMMNNTRTHAHNVCVYGWDECMVR